MEFMIRVMHLFAMSVDYSEEKRFSLSAVEWQRMSTNMSIMFSFIANKVSSTIPLEKNAVTEPLLSDWYWMWEKCLSSTYKNEMDQGPCVHLGFKCWDMGIVAWVMTNVVLDD
jgi:hypothetical protein